MLGFELECNKCESVFEIRYPYIKEINNLQCPCCGTVLTPAVLQNIRAIAVNYETLVNTSKNFKMSLFEIDLD